MGSFFHDIPICFLSHFIASTASHLPNPAILIPLDQSVDVQAWTQFNFATPTTKTPVNDKFGYPLLFSSFTGSSELTSNEANSAKIIRGDFTFSVQLKPLVIQDFVLVRMKNANNVKKLYLNMHSGGEVTFG